jgi:ribosomal protein S18 acetylase RimI-like enzyme
VLAIDTSMENRIVGIATARNEDDDATPIQQLFDYWNGKHVGYIMTLGVHPDFRRTGLGSELLKVQPLRRSLP